MNLGIKWLLIVGFNALLGFYLGAVGAKSSQFVGVIDAFAGMLALQTSIFFGIDNGGSDLVSAYSLTMFTGFYLSIVCSIILLFITLISSLSEKMKKI